MGKSSAADLLHGFGVVVADTDLIARQIVEPGQPAVAEVRAVFGAGVFGLDGRLCRHELARIVFTNADARRKLEAILHPRILAFWLAQVEAWRAEKRETGVVIIPLLFETNTAGHFDGTICVACSFATQQRRLRERGWSAEQIEQRSSAQAPVERKMLWSDYVVWTEGSLDLHREQLRRILGPGAGDGAERQDRRREGFAF